MNIEKGTNNVSRVSPKSTVPQQGNVLQAKSNLNHFSSGSYQKTLIIRMVRDLVAQLDQNPKSQFQRALLSLVKDDETSKSK